MLVAVLMLLALHIVLQTADAHAEGANVLWFVLNYYVLRWFTLRLILVDGRKRLFYGVAPLSGYRTRLKFYRWSNMPVIRSDKITVGRLLRIFRRSRNITLGDAVRATEINIVTLSEIERDLRRATQSQMLSLVLLYKVDDVDLWLKMLNAEIKRVDYWAANA